MGLITYQQTFQPGREIPFNATGDFLGCIASSGDLVVKEESGTHLVVRAGISARLDKPFQKLRIAPVGNDAVEAEIVIGQGEVMDRRFAASGTLPVNIVGSENTQFVKSFDPLRVEFDVPQVVQRASGQTLVAHEFVTDDVTEYTIPARQGRQWVRFRGFNPSVGVGGVGGMSVGICHAPGATPFWTISEGKPEETVDSAAELIVRSMTAHTYSMMAVECF
ncbi:MAG: hypothetical protein AAF092_10540 [Pseudomonadota bacterium]